MAQRRKREKIRGNERWGGGMCTNRIEEYKAEAQKDSWTEKWMILKGEQLYIQRFKNYIQNLILSLYKEAKRLMG